MDKETEDILNLLMKNYAGLFDQISAEFALHKIGFELTSELATQLRLSAEREVKVLKMLEQFVLDYSERIAKIENRPQSDVEKEVNARLAAAVPGFHLKVL